MNQNSEEVEIDNEQCFVQAKSLSIVCTSLFELLKSTEVPEQVQRGLSIAMERVKSPEIFTSLLPTINSLFEEGRKVGTNFGPALSVVLSALLERFSSESASVSDTYEGWNTFQKVMGNLIDFYHCILTFLIEAHHLWWRPAGQTPRVPKHTCRANRSEQD